MRITEAFQCYDVELKAPAWTSSGVSENPRQVVLSLWAHNFSDDMLSYSGDMSRWKGAGPHIFRQHLALALAKDLPIRVVVATSDDPDAVAAGNATKVHNDFEAHFDLVGRVARLEGDEFDLVFRRVGEPPATDVASAAKSPVKYWHVAECVEALGRASTTIEIRGWLAAHYPAEDHSDLNANLALLTVNDPNRRHYDKARANWRSDSGHARDRLFRRGKFRGVTYEPFQALAHGHWDLQPDAEGVWAAIALPSSQLAQAEAEAQGRAFEHMPPLDSEHDARVWTLTAVAQRQGQSAFRAQLLEAYGHRCAITGCRAVAVLEAAHILPYRGEHTHRMDNGLLLRSDLHTLFDLGLFWVTPGHRLVVAPALRGTEYEELDGKELRLPSQPAHHPNPAHLTGHARLAREKHGLGA